MKAQFGKSLWITSFMLVSLLYLSGCGKKNQAQYTPPPAPTNPNPIGGGFGGGGFVGGGGCLSGIPLNNVPIQSNLVSTEGVPGSNGVQLTIMDLSNSGNYLSGNKSIGAQANLTWGSLAYINPNPYQQGTQPIFMCSASGGTFNYGQINIELTGQTLAMPPQMPGFYQQPMATEVRMHIQGVIDQTNRLQGQVGLFIQTQGRWFGYQAW